MGSFFTLKVDLDELTDAMYAFVIDPHPSRNERPVIEELSDINHDLVDLLECMVLDGTEERADVSAFVHAVFDPHGDGPVKTES
ncbi:MAG TPA: hypothetical protein VNZ55_10495 [Thermomicrobiales bacterium]|nr:hypothetical protein [Thermomicrobiales bacterium]